MPGKFGMRVVVLPSGERLTFWGEPRQPPYEGLGDLYVRSDLLGFNVYIWTHDDCIWDAFLYRNMLVVMARSLSDPGWSNFLGSWDDGRTWYQL
jgi:hypothetical protein